MGKFNLQNQQVIFKKFNDYAELEGYVLKIKHDQLAENIGLECTELAEIIYKDTKGNYEIVKVPVSSVLGVYHR